MVTIKHYLRTRWNETHPLLRLAIIAAPVVYAVLVTLLWLFADEASATVFTLILSLALATGVARLAVEWWGSDGGDGRGGGDGGTSDEPDPSPADQVDELERLYRES